MGHEVGESMRSPLVVLRGDASRLLLPFDLHPKDEFY